MHRNRVAGRSMQAGANAPAWFAGREDSAHTHHASLSGLKSQQLSTNKGGQGGYNQLVFDDTPARPGIELATTEYEKRLQRQCTSSNKTDNARQADRGHGGELATQASLALRAGHGPAAQCRRPTQRRWRPPRAAANRSPRHRKPEPSAVAWRPTSPTSRTPRPDGRPASR